MLDRLFAPLLTFVTLIAGTAGFASALVYTPRNEVALAQGMPPQRVAMLERVEIVARREQEETAQGRDVLMQRARD